MTREDTGLHHAVAQRHAWANNYGTTLPLSVLSGALKIADKVTVAMEAVGDKIRSNSQGWEDARVIGERQGADGRGA